MSEKNFFIYYLFIFFLGGGGVGGGGGAAVYCIRHLHLDALVCRLYRTSEVAS